MRFDDLDGPAGGARGEAGARERDAGTPQSTGARSHLAQLQGTIPHIQTLVEQWRSLADDFDRNRDQATRVANAVAFSWLNKCADQLLAVLVSPPMMQVTETKEDTRVDGVPE
jgi:hypothetical protein